MKPSFRAWLSMLALWAAASAGQSCGARSDLNPGELKSDLAPAVPCKPGLFTLHKANPTLLLVIDRSRSMLSDFGVAGQSRWAVLRSALGRALPPVDDTMAIGALLFPAPGSSGTSCSVSGTFNLGPSTGNVASLLALLSANPPGGSTPTADAIATAARSLQGIRAASTARALVLATDGAPDCNPSLNVAACVCLQGNNCQAGRCLDDTRTVGRIASAAAEGLPTYVIGIQDGGTSPLAAVLDAMAVAGQRPQTGQAHRYYAASSEAELRAALVTIRDQVGACTYLTASVPDQRGTIALPRTGESSRSIRRARPVGIGPTVTMAKSYCLPSTATRATPARRLSPNLPVRKAAPAVTGRERISTPPRVSPWHIVSWLWVSVVSRRLTTLQDRQVHE